MFSPGDFVQVIEHPIVTIDWHNIKPGMQGVVMTPPYSLMPEPGYGYRGPVVSVLFGSNERRVWIELLRKLSPPPADEVETDEREAVA